jgi:uncharacterized repeat protein (TIGR01451 family)
MQAKINPLRKIVGQLPSILALSLLLLAGGTTAAAAAATPEPSPAPGPQLSISLTNNTNAVDVGDPLAYSLVVSNVGTDDAPGLRVTQTVPEGARFVSADAEGTVAGPSVGWTVDVPAGSSATLSSAMTVDELPATSQRIASVGCALTAVDTTPLVCASDSDELPAAAVAPHPSGGTSPVMLAAYAALLASIVLIVITATGRLRRSQRSSPTR